MQLLKTRLRNFKLSGIYNNLEERVNYAKEKSLSYGEFLDVWNQMKTDILDIPHCRFNVLEAGTFGATILAGVGVGIYDNLIEPIGKILKIIKICNSIRKNRLKHDQYYEFYKNFTENINKMDLFNGYDKLRHI